MKWYTWLTIILIVLVSIPLKIKFIKMVGQTTKKMIKEVMIDDKSRRVEIFLWKR